MTTGNWELIRALGAVADSPSSARYVGSHLGLTPVGEVEHTEVFMLNCPPYASIHLGAEGGLGGEGTDRVAGFWRAIGLEPPAEPDHLTALFSLYANLGQAAGDVTRAKTAEALKRMHHALLWEHLWSWLPGYLDAVIDLGTESLPGWAMLTGQTLTAELRLRPNNTQLPLALRAAPAPLEVGFELNELLETVVAPIRSGFVITRHSLARAAGYVGVGQRIGERQFTLRAMLEQDPKGTLSWLSEEAVRWSVRHAERSTEDLSSQWWAERARTTGTVLASTVTAHCIA